MYLLDFTSEVEVTDCKNCKIFIGKQVKQISRSETSLCKPSLTALYAGPVDGPAIFNNCNSSQVTVACQQFQAKNCQDIEFGEYRYVEVTDVAEA